MEENIEKSEGRLVLPEKEEGELIVGDEGSVVGTKSLAGLADVVLDASDEEDLMLTKLDKAVCTNDTFEDLQRALTYEAVFSTLIENKMLAMKRDCEERKRIKRMKRKSIGRIFFSKKLFGGGSRKNSTLHTGELEDEMIVVDEDTGRVRKVSSQISAFKLESIESVKRSPINDIEVASASSSGHQMQMTNPKASAVTVETPVAADDSLTSTVSNDNPSFSSGKNSSGVAVKRNLLVTVQTHGPAEVVTSSSSGDSKDGATRLSTNGAALPSSYIDRSYDATSLVSGYDNGGGGRINTSTMADDSLTSIRDSIESLSFASSRCTVSFGATEVIPEDTASLLYERARVAKRLRILEAKSISAQCSPVFPRHVLKSLPLPASPLTKTAVTPLPALPSITPASLPPKTISSSTVPKSTQQRLLPNQVSYTDSMYGCGAGGPGAAGDSDAAFRFFSRQNTSEDSANVTVSTLLNEGDSLSLHAAMYSSSSSAAAAASSGVSKMPFSPADRFKSKSTSLLMNSNTRSLPPQPALPIQQLEQLHISSNISRNERLVDSFRSKNNNNLSTHKVITAEKHQQQLQCPLPALEASQQQPISCTASSHYFPVISPIVTDSLSMKNIAVATNGGAQRPANGVIVASGNLSGDTAKLHRMTSTSTGSSVVPTGCCTTTAKSSSRDKEKQRFKPSWPTGQSGSDDEYRRRKRKYSKWFLICK